MYQRDVLPSYAGIHTFFRAPQGEFDQIQPGIVAVVGVPWDGTLGSRPGCRYGPAAIRQTSSHLYYYLATSPTMELFNLATGDVLRLGQTRRLLDLGDLNLYPYDIMKTSESIADGVTEVVTRGGFPVILGGDHYITFPAFLGVSRALGDQIRLGYIQLDAHFDLSDDNRLWGRYYHGSNARRISELPVIRPQNMAWVGVRGYARKEQVEWARSSGATFVTAYEVDRFGTREAINRAIEAASKGTDGVYISVDIDVVDPCFAPGTGSIAFGGLTPAQFLEAAELLKTARAVALDLVEVAPNLDPTGVTERLAAQFILNYIAPKIFN